MIQEAGTVVVGDEEQLARFILFSKWIRSSDQTVKPEAFLPDPNFELSVTRHLALTDEALWNVGENVAAASARNLHGRADIGAGFVRQQSLNVDSAPVQNNPNHANIINWPPDKPAQKIIALVLASHSVYRVKP